MNNPADKGQEPAKYLRPRRPFPLKLIFWVFALWTLLGWFRFVRVVGESGLILDLLGLQLFGYLLLAGLIWGLLGLPVLWGLMKRTRWTPLLIKVAALVYPTLYWVERTLLWRDPYAQRNWPFMLLMTGVWFGLVIWGLRSAQNSAFFTNNESNYSTHPSATGLPEQLPMNNEDKS